MADLGITPGAGRTIQTYDGPAGTEYAAPVVHGIDGAGAVQPARSDSDGSLVVVGPRAQVTSAEADLAASLNTFLFRDYSLFALLASARRAAIVLEGTNLSADVPLTVYGSLDGAISTDHVLGLVSVPAGSKGRLYLSGSPDSAHAAQSLYLPALSGPLLGFLSVRLNGTAGTTGTIKSTIILEA